MSCRQTNYSVADKTIKLSVNIIVKNRICDVYEVLLARIVVIDILT